MDVEDQDRFQVEAVAMPCEEADVILSCERCGWSAQLEGQMTLRDLIERAKQHHCS